VVAAGDGGNRGGGGVRGEKGEAQMAAVCGRSKYCATLRC